MEQLAWLWVIKNSNVKDNLMDRDREWVSRMLGEAVIDVWSGLPQDIQQKLFEQAVLTAGSADEEDLRERLAKFLHDHHQRTARHHV